ncbi:hypothetical protein Tco_1542102, partial [Tanacetum coccineum]
AMIEKDAFLVDDVEGGLCVDNTDAGIGGKDATVEAIRIRAKWENDDYICKGSYIECTWQEDSSNDLSLVQLGSHLEESLRAQKSDKGKGKKVGGPSVNMTKEVLLVPTRNQSWNVRSVARLITSKGIAVVVDAIAWRIDSGATTHVCKDSC